MPRLVCPHCSKTLEFSGQVPTFCAYCGQRLGPVPLNTPLVANGAATAPPPPPTPDETQPPLSDSRAATVAPSSMTEEAEDCPPATIGGYRVLGRLGGGGMGSVYQVEEAASGRSFALKLIRPEYASSPDALKRFHQEGRLAALLVHPRCVFVHAAEEADGQAYLVMELMPGLTLQDLVAQKGPLPVEEALEKIMDVIDGLLEAHRLGLVHRDVKPSNCFLEADGRVKIGDFGLSKSLSGDAKLTRTGAFLGTPLYASPEQIKLEPVDQRSDLYSVAATLYFLLTGRAPHEAGDPAATIARIVAEPVPRPRAIRKEIGRQLEKILLKGLERDRKHRYRDLDEFRFALQGLLPTPPGLGGAGIRLSAFIADVVLLSMADAALHNAANWMGMEIPAASMTVLFVSYFGVLEGWLGWTLGKRLGGLRVCSTDSGQSAGILRGLLRVSMLYLLFVLPGWFPTFVRSSMGGAFLSEALIMVGLVVYVVAMVAPLLERTGYRGLYEMLSGTRTVRQMRPKRRTPRQRLAARVARPPLRQADMPKRTGPFRILGVVAASPNAGVLVAQDPSISRQMWIWLRDSESPVLEDASKEVNRATRCRWVASGSYDDGRKWDAFVAPNGQPLAHILEDHGPLSWAETRTALENLVEEFTACAANQTMPGRSALWQVTIDGHGKAQLLPFPLPAGDRDEAWENRSDSLAWLRDFVIQALEGRPRDPASGSWPVRAALPEHDRAWVDRLVGAGPPIENLEELQRFLRSTDDLPSEMTRKLRSTHLIKTGLLQLAFLGFGVGVVGGPLAVAQHYSLWPMYCLLFLVLWSYAFRGGYVLWREEVRLRRLDGRKAARWQCALRTILAWGPVALLTTTPLLLGRLAPELLGPPEYSHWAGAISLSLSVFGVAIYWVVSLRDPRSSPVDRLLGLRFVPK